MDKKRKLLNEDGMSKKIKPSKEGYSIIGISETQSPQIVCFYSLFTANPLPILDIQGLESVQVTTKAIIDQILKSNPDSSN
jgi:hypothetical protein